jgi:hypothetical protein
VILRCALETGQRQAERRPTVIFVSYLRTLLMQKKVYLAGMRGAAPSQEPDRYGYDLAHDERGLGVPLPRPGAEKIGWVGEGKKHEGFIYLDPAAAYKAVVKFGRESEAPLPVQSQRPAAYLLVAR